MTIPILLLVVHTIADFVLQSNTMATQKSKNNYWLTMHVFVYSLCFLPWGIPFFVVTFWSHWLTDWVTSRVTSRLWFFTPLDIYYNIGKSRYQMWIPKGGDRHWFFVAIGVDQLIHFTTLAVTYHLLRG